MTLGAFAIIIGLNTPERPVETVDDLAGLARSASGPGLQRWRSSSSAWQGIPPLAGFLGKFNLFVAAFAASSDSDARLYQSLAVIGVINSAIGAYYYLKIVVAMYYRDPTGAPLASRPTWPAATAIGTCVGLTVLLGVFPTPLYKGTREAAVALASHPEPRDYVSLEASQKLQDALERKLREDEEAASKGRATRGLRWAPETKKRAMP